MMDDLPVELTQRIIGFLPADSALTLSRVNRALYEACNHPLVFKSIIDNRNGPGDELLVELKGRWPPGLSPEDSVDLWARMAVADYRSIQLSKKGALMRGALTWLPQLIQTHHPIIDAIDIGGLVTALVEVSSDPATFRIFGFCSSTRALCQTQASHTSDWADARSKLTPFLRFMPEVGNLFAVANAVVGALHIDLLQSIKQNQIRFLSPGRKNHIPPSPYNFPFPELMVLPPPFSIETIESFSTAHLWKMTTAEFLEEGEWVGYYCYIYHFPRAVFDAAMHRIFFKSTGETGSSSLMLSAQGAADGIGDFDLTGEIDQQSGMITMVKQYSDTTSWRWRAVMTPFGIVGHWGHAGGGSGGWLWLWKAGWNEE